MSAPDASGPLASVRAELRTLDVSDGALRRFGWTVGGVFLAGAVLWAWRHGWTWTAISGGVALVGGGLVGLGTVAPRALRGAQVAWMALAFAMGWVMTRVLLTLAWALVFVPIGVLFRLTRRDVLHRRPDAETATYWQPVERSGSPKERMERMF